MHISAIPTKHAQAFRQGAPDAHGQKPERAISNGRGNPCRHCLKNIPKGAPMLILAYRPFDDVNPYAETGPIFLCAEDCERHNGGSDLPPVLTSSPDYLIKGYTDQNRILYGTGAVVPTQDMQDRIAAIFSNPDVAYVHIRSARNNCYQARVDRGSHPSG